MGVRILLRQICLEFHDLSIKKVQTRLQAPRYQVLRLILWLPATDQEWATELSGFLENNVFPCIVA